jgi:hypothetical protein
VRNHLNFRALTYSPQANICVHLKYIIGNFWISGILTVKGTGMHHRRCAQKSVTALLKTYWIIGHSFFMPKYSYF